MLSEPESSVTSTRPSMRRGARRRAVGGDVMRADADRIVAVGDGCADPAGGQADAVADQDLAALLGDRRRVDRRIGKDAGR